LVSKRDLRELKRKSKVLLGLRNTVGDRIIIEDRVIVWQGDRSKKPLVNSRGHIVNQGLIQLANMMGCDRLSAYTSSHGLPADASPATEGDSWENAAGGYMLCGTGSGATTGVMTDLVTKDLTIPNVLTGTITNPAGNTYRVSYIVTWNAGTIGALAVTEIGLYLCLDVTLRSFSGQMIPANRKFFSRLSVSDGDFSSFVIDTSKPLTIEWQLTFTFA